MGAQILIKSIANKQSEVRAPKDMLLPKLKHQMQHVFNVHGAMPFRNGSYPQFSPVLLVNSYKRLYYAESSRYL
jgi:hypothetical protein